eukprot:CAMPEP_0171299204 /NCGR_PEP_ID=MMETSP0816-20121228/8019_1 /TAXON_ID=420281 /ORGANISM="Proboscia inermis, Strain CCAP1064/1" /LENGTH=479 /DNA_ID=CAMNT_0011774835 /DNA_START=52 /DNA_END=1491 /DNA_ORIENTATION=-
MADFAKRDTVTVSTMGTVHNPNGEGVPAISEEVKKKLNISSTGQNGSTRVVSSPTPPPSPSHPPRDGTNHETKVKEEGSSRRNITRKKSDHPSGNYDARSKKQGGAGKGKWTDALDGSDTIPILDLDEGDPMYDDEQKPHVLVSSEYAVEEREIPTGYDPVVNKPVYGPMLTLPEFKIRISEALLEYFDSGDSAEFITCIVELKCKEYHHEIVKKAISLSLDKTSRERELTSKLLTVLHPKPLGDDVMAQGFDILLESLTDLMIDAPDAKSIVGAFLARAVVDEVLPPAFLSKHKNKSSDLDAVATSASDDELDETESVVEIAMRLLSREHSVVRLEKVWGPGDGRPVTELKVVMDQLLKEYLLSRELDEAARCIRELNTPHFHHELIKRGGTVAMEEGDHFSSHSSQLDAMAALFIFLVRNAIVSDAQVVKGMERLRSNLEDLKLDVSPRAPELLKEFEECLKEKADDEGITLLPDTN